MGFNDVSAEAYDRFMGRYSTLLSPLFADFAGLGASRTPGSGVQVLDVGCGTGALIAELASRLGPEAITAVDPAARFVQAVRERHPRVDVHEASAGNLPFPDSCFDAAPAQLVLHFLPDPVAGLTEMQRVTRTGGAVMASVWDFAGARSPVSIFWGAACELDPGVRDESLLPGARQGHLRDLFTAAGLQEILEVPLEIAKRHDSFDEWWTPYTRGVGPAGAYYAGLDPDHQLDLRERCRAKLPHGPFEITSRAWAARGVVGAP